jgi:divalent metal cation (Fe/Co/Zn/Cd) transporter
MTVAMLLARESRGLLVGEAADRRTLDDIRRITTSDPAVERMGRALTAHFGPRTVVLNLDLQFRRGLSASDVVDAVDRIERALQRDHPELRYIFVESRSLRPSPQAEGVSG